MRTGTVLLNQVKQWDIHAKQSTDSHVNSYILIEGGKGGVRSRFTENKTVLSQFTKNKGIMKIAVHGE